MRKRILTVLLCISLSLSMVACGGSKDDMDNNQDKIEQDVDSAEEEKEDEKEKEENEAIVSDDLEGESSTENVSEEEKEETREEEMTANAKYADETGIFLFDNNESITPQWDEDIDTKSIYQNLTYDEKMFYGVYTLKPDPDNDDELKEYIDNVNYGARIAYDGSYMSDLPCQIEAGPKTLSSVVYNNRDYDWMRLYYYREDGYLCDLTAAYEVSGDTLTISPIAEGNYDDQNKTFECTFFPSYVYTFEFNGIELTLSDGVQSVVLQAPGFEREKVSITSGAQSTDYHIPVEHKLSSYSDVLPGVNKISMHLYSGSDWFVFYDENGNETRDGIAYMDKNGLFKMQYTDGHIKNTKVFTHQFAFFYCKEDGLILTDGEHVYYFQD